MIKCLIPTNSIRAKIMSLISTNNMLHETGEMARYVLLYIKKTIILIGYPIKSLICEEKNCRRVNDWPD